MPSLGFREKQRMKDLERDMRRRARDRVQLEARFRSHVSSPGTQASQPYYESSGATGDGTLPRGENLKTKPSEDMALTKPRTLSSTHSHEPHYKQNFDGTTTNLPSIMDRKKGDITGYSAALKHKITEGELPSRPSSELESRRKTQHNKLVKQDPSPVRSTVETSHVPRRAVGAPTKARKSSRGSTSPRKPESVDSGRRLSNSYPSVPKDFEIRKEFREDAEKHSKTVSRTNSENFYDDADDADAVSELSDDIRGRGISKSSRALITDYMQQKRQDTTKAMKDGDSEDLSDEETLATNETEVLKARLKKKIQQLKALNSEKERESGRLEGIEAAYKTLYEKQLSEEKAAHAIIVKGLEEKMNEMRSNHDAEEQEMQRNLLSQKEKFEKGLLDKKRSYERSATLAQTEYNTELASVNEKLRLAKEAKVREIGVLRGEHAGELRELREEIAFWKSKLETLSAEKDGEIESLTTKYNNTIALENEKSQRIVSDFNSQLNGLKGKYATEKADMQAQHQININNARYELQKRVQDLENQLRQVTQTKDEMLEKNMRAYDTEITKMRHEHEIDKENHSRLLHEDNEALRGLLFKRENFKAMTDDELGERFTDICNEIDEFARVEWNSACGSNWPMPEYLLPKKPLVAQRHLIQNSMWVILYDKIFCTPFRMFGREGRGLETKWSGEGRRGGSSSAKEFEQWRYEAITKFAKSIKNSAGNSDPIKDEYETTLKAVTDEILHELRKVATINDIKRHGADEQTVSSVVREAAQLWLDIGQQRFRTRIVMSGNGENAVKSRQTALSSTGTLNLVVFPGLRRVGNAQGDQLGQEEQVMNCEGTFTVFRSR